MFNDYYKKNKQEIFPWVKDWTDPQNHLRHSNNVKEMSYSTWFWFHPSAYKIIHYGFSGSSGFCFILLSIWMYFKGIYLVSFIAIVMVLIFGNDLRKKVGERKIIKDRNMYDIYMREDKEC